MKKISLLFLMLLLAISFISCDDATDPVVETGTIYVDSNPQGAEVWLDDVNTNQVTPATVSAEVGLRSVTLKKAGYSDLTFSVSVEANQQSIVTENTLQKHTGTLQITTTPAGAKILFSNQDSGNITPYTNSTQEIGTYIITLQLDGYNDTTVTAEVTSGATTPVNITLVPQLIHFSTSIRIWETTGTTAAQPSGLDLSSGNAYGTSDVNNRGNIDLYYYSNSDGTTYLVQSASLNTNMTRETFFKVSSATNLNDGADSPAKDGTWANHISDREGNYVFLYDADSHYSKLKIVAYGGGSGVGDPAWVEVQWIYNAATSSLIF
jgi:hypothetical protein